MKQAGFLSVSQAAAMAGVTPQTIRNLIKSGVLAAIRRGSVFMVIEKQVKEYAKEQYKRVEVEEKTLAEYLQDIERAKAEIQAERQRVREYLKEVQMTPQRLRAVCECVSAFAAQYGENSGELSEREKGIFYDYLRGGDLSETGHKYGLQRERTRQIWFSVLRKYKHSESETERQRGIIEQQRCEIERLRSIIESAGKEVITQEWQDMFDILHKDIRDCGFSVRAYNCLRCLDCVTVADMVQLSRSEVLRVRNMGKKTLKEIEDYLNLNGLQWRMDIRMWQK